jgi:hypothetical protein
MENNNITKQEVLKFSAEMEEEEASVKMAIANVCGVNATDGTQADRPEHPLHHDLLHHRLGQGIPHPAQIYAA